MHCRQCMGSCNDPNKCQCEPCELRLREMAIRKSTNPNAKPKMTRQEAIANSKRVGHIDAIGLVNALEALGLLKFDRESDSGKEKYNPNKEIYDIIHAHYELPNNLIHDLHVCGYKIVRNFEEDGEDKLLTEVLYRARMASQDTSVSQRNFLAYLAVNGYKIVRNT
jgi:hypothetical protein